MDDSNLKALIRDLLARELSDSSPPPPQASSPPSPQASSPPGLKASKPRLQASKPPGLQAGDSLALAKRVASWLGQDLPLSPWFGSWQPTGNAGYYLSRTPARLDVGRTGPRYRTDTVLGFLTDHAAARDAVHSDLDPAVLEPLGIVPLQSAAADKREFLARPDRGRRLSDTSAGTVQRTGLRAPQVQFVFGDGLSATAINTNLPLLFPLVEAELKRQGIRVGTPFAVSNARVAVGDHIARLTDAEVLCTIVGERPGLKTAESMGAYVTYMKVRTLNEAMRFMVSNIHKGGLHPEREGARQVTDLIFRALRDKRTGVDMS